MRLTCGLNLRPGYVHLFVGPSFTGVSLPISPTHQQELTSGATSIPLARLSKLGCDFRSSIWAWLEILQAGLQPCPKSTGSFSRRKWISGAI